MQLITQTPWQLYSLAAILLSNKPTEQLHPVSMTIFLLSNQSSMQQTSLETSFKLSLFKTSPFSN